MKRNELIVLLIIAEGRGDELFQMMKRDEVLKTYDALVEMQLLEPSPYAAKISMKITDRARAFLGALDTLPLPQATWTMVHTGE